MLIVDHKQCQQKLIHLPGGAKNLTSDMICARDYHSTNISRGTCKGDSGGPFVCFGKADQRWYLRGVISWGSARWVIMSLYYNYV